MEKFDLQEYMKTPARKVVTRNGSSVRIICTNRMAADYPLVALVSDDDMEDLLSYTRNGELYKNQDDGRDLFFVPLKKDGWVNIYKDTYGDTHLGRIYTSKEEAEAMAKSCGLYYVTTIKIEWEE